LAQLVPARATADAKSTGQHFFIAKPTNRKLYSFAMENASRDVWHFANGLIQLSLRDME